MTLELLTIVAAKKHTLGPPTPPPETFSSSGTPWGLILILVGGVALVGLIAYLSYLSTKRRRLGFQTMARQLGLSYSLEDPFGLLGEPFALFQRGDGRGLENVLSGVWQGLDLRAFDYWYYEESTDSNGRTSRSYSRFDCAIVPIGAACPALSIGHETFFTRIAGALVVGNRVLVAGPKIPPAELVQLIGTAKAFVDHVPKVVFSLYPVAD